jgi:predicted Kef-type K+ transport protein
MDPIWLSIAFLFGLGVRAIGLPPLVGYLLAGFALNYFGAEQGEFVSIVSDLGITLLLFTIGLKLKIKNLIKPEIWAGASLHMGITTIIFAVIIFGLSFSGLNFFSNLSWQVLFLLLKYSKILVN